MFISGDLIREVLKYVPREHLKKLSKAHALFAQEIYSAGIRIFFSIGGPVDLTENNVTLIQMESGKKYAIKDICNKYSFLPKIHYGEKCSTSLNMRWTNSINDMLWAPGITYYDPIENVVVVINESEYIFMEYDAMGDDRFIRAYKLFIRYDRDDVLEHLDMESCIAMSKTQKYYETWIRMNRFKIIYADGAWVK